MVNKIVQNFKTIYENNPLSFEDDHGNIQEVPFNDFIAYINDNIEEIRDYFDTGGDDGAINLYGE